MKVKFKSFSSGSCGNCYFIGLYDEQGKRIAGLLVDAGVSVKRLKLNLAAENMTIDDIDAVLVTHDHLDHIRNLGPFCVHLKKPVWTTSTLHYALAHHSYTGDCIAPCRRILMDKGETPIINPYVKVKWFEVPHDATQTVGYFIDLAGYHLMIMTDAGACTPEALEFASQSDTVVIEANYDDEMLENGPYTRDLKERVGSNQGHLSNTQCAEAVSNFLHEGLRNIFLCHLSENNNTPQLAYDTVKAALDKAGANDIRLQTLPRMEPSPMIIL